MKYAQLDKIYEIVGNRYEAVIVAAKRARQINSERLAKLELMPEGEESPDLDPRKVTSVAMSELVEGKLKIER